MIIAIFDTETTGLPKFKEINMKELDSWPYIVQFSYILFNTETYEIIKIVDSVVKLENPTEITEENSKIHGITNEISRTKGTNIDIILKKFFKNIQNVDLIVAHNMSFDLNMIKVELLRLFKKNEENDTYSKLLSDLENYKKYYCTMQESIDLCNITVQNKFNTSYVKFPKLVELYEKLFNKTPKNLHNSLNDVLVTLKCFMKLKFNIDVCDFSKEIKELFIPLL